MSLPDVLKIMISSRCRDLIAFQGERKQLSVVRAELKRRLEGIQLMGAQVFEVWINEDAPPAPADKDSWDFCLDQVDRCDLLLVLYNGNAGWAASESGVGICHAELDRAISKFPHKVRIIELKEKTRDRAKRNTAFSDYYAKLRRFRGGVEAEDGEQAIELAEAAIRGGVVQLARVGSRGPHRGQHNIGEALDWTKMGFRERKTAMEAEVCAWFGQESDTDGILSDIEGKSAILRVSAVPDSFSTDEARELAGRPFLLDHALVNSASWKKRKPVGPIHIIAVHKNITETQAKKYLGHPDIMLVDAPFGFYVADRINHIQVLILANCRDRTSTRERVQRCWDWIDQSGEAPEIVTRAAKRAEIISVLSKLSA